MSLNLQETIDNFLISNPEELRYQKLSSFIETFLQTNPKDLLKSLDIYYLQNKFENLEDLLLISLLYKTFLSLNSLLKTSFFAFENEKNSLNLKLKNRLKALSEAKKLTKLCFCDFLKQNSSEKNEVSSEKNEVSSQKFSISSEKIENSSEKMEVSSQINKHNSFDISLEKIRNNIKILYSDLFQPLLLHEEYFGYGFRFLGKIFLKWALILEVSFESEELFLIIELMKTSINPKLYQLISFIYGIDFSNFFRNLKFIIKFSTRKKFNKGNIAVFFEVFTEDEIRKLVRDSWELLKKFIENNKEIAINGVKSIFEVCFTRKTLRFFFEVSKALKKEKEVERMKGFYKEIVIGVLLERLKGNFFGEVLEILKIYIIGKFVVF